MEKWEDLGHFVASPYTLRYPVSTYTKRTALESTFRKSKKNHFFHENVESDSSLESGQGG